MTKMSLREFLPLVLPENGPYITATTGHDGQLNRQNHCDSLLIVAASLDSYAAKRLPAYFAVGSFIARKRTQKTALKKRVLYADLDCGGSNPQYASKQEAMRAIKQFYTTTKLKPSIVVDSGNGYHLYWRLETDVPIHIWEEYAKALDREFTAQSFAVDRKITLDTARVLRAPATVNYKDPKNPKLCDVVANTNIVYSLGELSELLHMVDPESGVDIAPAAQPLETDDEDYDLGGGMADPRPKMASEMVVRCHAFKDAMAYGGATHRGELWHKLMHTLAYCEDGKDFIHPISKEHPDYTPEGAETRFGYACNKRDENPAMGATTCAKIGEAAPELCKACDYVGQIKSPIALALRTTSKLPEVAVGFPYSYYQNADGIFRKGAGEEDPPKLITSTRIANVQLCDDLQDGMVIVFDNISVTPKTAIRLTGKALTASDTSASSAALTTGKIWMHGKQRGMFNDMMISWAQQLQAAGLTRKSSKAYGWVNDGEHNGFSAGANIWWDDGSVTISPRADPKLADQYMPTGSLDTWRQVVQTITVPGRPEAQIAVASAFGAPLLKYTGHSGAILSFVSPESGTGKTTALKAAQSVWGCPQRGLNSLNDTPLSVTNKLGILNNLPAYWDEIRVRDDPDGFVKMIFQVAQGKEKARLTSGIQQQNMGTWHTLIGCASNEALRDHIDHIIKGSDAGMMRVLEMAMPMLPSGQSVASSMQRYGLLNANYGVAGEVYAQWLATNLPTVERDLTALMAGLDTKCNFRSEERFWLATIACIVLGAQYATKLGILHFDVKEIAARLVQIVIDQRGASYNPNPTVVTKAVSKLDKLRDLITAFKADSADSGSVSINMNLIGSGVRSPMGISILREVKRPPIRFQYDQTSSTLRIVLPAFKTWLYEAGHDVTSTLGTLLALPGVHKSKAKVYTSANLKGMPECIDVPLGSGASLADPNDDGDDIKPHINDAITSGLT